MEIVVDVYKFVPMPSGSPPSKQAIDKKQQQQQHRHRKSVLNK